MCAPGSSGAAAAERSPERSGNCVYTQSCTADICSMEKRGEDYNIQVNAILKGNIGIAEETRLGSQGIILS